MAVVLTSGAYVHWGVISISVTNLLIIAGMLLVFALAILLPFPHHGESPADQPAEGTPHDGVQP